MRGGGTEVHWHHLGATHQIYAVVWDANAGTNGVELGNLPAPKPPQAHRLRVRVIEVCECLWVCVRWGGGGTGGGACRV